MIPPGRAASGRASLPLVIAVCACGIACRSGDPSAPLEPPATAATKPRPADLSTPPADATGGAPATPAVPSRGPVPAGMDAGKAAACDQGDAAACLAAASAFAPQGAYRVDGKLTAAEADRHEVETARYAQRACDLGNGDGCVLAARFHRQGKDRTAALRRGCELGKLGACGDYGWGLVSAGDGAGQPFLEQACRGDALGTQGSQRGAYCNFASSLFRGQGDSRKFKNPAKANEMRALACKQGWMAGCPCKKDPDCKGTTKDVDWFCNAGKCAAPSAD